MIYIERNMPGRVIFIGGVGMRNRRKRIRDDEEGGVGALLWSFWKAVFIAVGGFAVMIFCIFESSAYTWRSEQKRLEIAAEKKMQVLIDKMSVVGVYTWKDSEDRSDDGEKRSAEKMEVGTEYRIGAHQIYDRNRKDREYTAEDYERLGDRFFHNCFMIDPNDDTYFADPVITFIYANYLDIKFSIDNDEGVYEFGPTAVGTKTGNYKYIPGEASGSASKSSFTKGPTTVKVVANGTGGVSVNVDDTTISEDMRQYNYVTTERLADVYPGVDKKYADRTREVSTCHLIISAYKNDPRGKANRGPNTPETTFKVRIRYYGAWDLSKAEYDEAVFTAPDMSLVDYSPTITAELVP